MERDENGFEFWDTWVGKGWRRGQYWVPRGNSSALAYMIAEMEADMYGDRKRGVRNGDVVLDAGANVGVFVNEALERRAKLVVAIELSPRNVDVLKKTFAEDIAAGRVIVYPKGVWNEDGEITLRVTDVSWRDTVSFSTRGEAGPTVQLTTIDKMVTELGLDKVDFIKMDIEGAEVNALKGAGKTLARFQPRMAVTFESRKEDIDNIPAAVLAAQPDYKMCLWGETIMFE